MGLASCKIDRDPSIIVQEMMNVQNGLLVNDLGVKYSITGSAMAIDILSYDRVFVSGSAVPSTVAGYDYTLDPYEWYSVTIQDCVTLSSVEDADEAFGTSPINLSHVWFQGGYVNALVTVSYSDEEDFNGEINLVFDDSRSNGADKMYFLLKNKQEGKTWADEDLSATDAVFGSQFISFPYTQFVDPGFKGEQSFYMEWLWFVPSDYDGELPYRTTKDMQGRYIVNVQ